MAATAHAIQLSVAADGTVVGCASTNTTTPPTPPRRAKVLAGVRTVPLAENPLRLEARAQTKAMVARALARSGATAAVARCLRVTGDAVAHWADEDSPADITLRDVVAAPRSFGAEVLRSALSLVEDSAPRSGLSPERLAEETVMRVMEVYQQIRRLREQGEGREVRRELVRALDQVIDHLRELREQLARDDEGGR